MTDIIVGIFAFLGTVFVFLAAVGMIRMPDTYLRISVTTKAATLGIGLLMLAGAIYSNDIAITAKVLAIILFILLTAPVSAHLIGRTSYYSGVKLWKDSVMDDLKGKYNASTEVLHSDMKNASEGPSDKKEQESN
ncbi:monovalent cation/H(+) antiporter subunit G [Antarcticibacterium arcticum]|uniref:Monovalent cation/H(+) antiporter subunit G n=1 Tax=Antarcticibacterium arcticum TaxID=2585771 RepID=A0A5B8YNS7_9FLAO|nr:monovalent cation/H(+) antiporter subunit G [Antarcticibacterium arcticum]QED38293.1 monovalent cation/H(+) antiporter subunit G [Antarcticibacterium arcticum]